MTACEVKPLTFSLNRPRVVLLMGSLCPQVLILEPSKVFQPTIVSVSEEDVSRTVQLQHVTPLMVETMSISFFPLSLSLSSLLSGAVCSLVLSSQETPEL